MSAEIPTAADIAEQIIAEQIEDMLTHLYQVQEDAHIWRSLIDDEPLRSALYDIEQGTHGLIDLVCKLEQPRRATQ